MIRRKELDHDLDKLRSLLVRMGDHVVEALDGAVLSLKTQDSEKAQEIVQADVLLNQMEEEIMDIGSRLIVTQQPVAKDLRRILVALKISSDLERMGDLALDVAKVTLRLQGEPLIKPLIDIPQMAEIVKVMIEEAITSYLNENTDLAYKMAQDDDQVDLLYSRILTELYDHMRVNPDSLSQALLFTLVGRYIERIATMRQTSGKAPCIS